jgi:hypothetical protein
VAINHDLPEGVEYEILEELFIPDDYSDDQSQSDNGRKTNFDLIETLVKESLRITDNLNDISSNNAIEASTGGQYRISASNWTPSGRIKVWDDMAGTTNQYTLDHYECYQCDTEIVVPCDLAQNSPITIGNICQRPVYSISTIPGKYVPIEGVWVRARRWFTTHKGKTDHNGVFVCDGDFKYAAQYSIRWDKYDFSVRAGNFRSGRISRTRIVRCMVHGHRCGSFY